MVSAIVSSCLDGRQFCEWRPGDGYGYMLYEALAHAQMCSAVVSLSTVAPCAEYPGFVFGRKNARYLYQR